MAVEKSHKALFIALIAILVAGAIIAVVVYAGRDSPSQQSASADKIKIELRASPSAEIQIDGNKIGKTPISIQYAKSDKDISIEATLLRTLTKRGGKKVEVYKGYRKVKLDRDQLIDFSYSNTTLVESEQTDPAAK
jgi:hypothetical protein